MPPINLNLALIKQNYVVKKVSRYSSLDDSDISLPVFPSRSNLKLHNISLTSKLDAKVISNLDFSKASGPDCIQVMVLKNCKSECSYKLSEIFNMCLKQSCFPDCWNVSLVSPVLNVCKKCMAKRDHSVSLLWLVNK